MSSNNTAYETAVVSTTGLDAQISTHFEIDRYMGDVLTLPFTFDDLKIKSNELVKADNINAVFAKLYHNFLYINSQTKVADNNFPKNYRGFVASTDTPGRVDLGWFPSVSANSDIKTQLDNKAATATMLSGVVAGDFVMPEYSPTEYFGVVALSSSIVGFKSSIDDTTVTVKLDETTVEDTADMTFQDIKAVKFNSENRLYVIDGTLVYKFDIDPVLTSNRAISSLGRFLIQTIGGKSNDIYDKERFNIPVDIAVGNNDNVYILDQGDYGFKYYDNNLNWMKTVACKNIFTTELSGGSAVAIDIDRTTDYVYILSDNGIILEYDDSFIFKKSVKIGDPIVSGETFRNITFSNKTSNVVYLQSTHSVYKKYITKLKNSIGSFRMSDNNIANETFTFCSIPRATDHTYDYVYIGGDSTHAGITTTVSKIYKFNEEVSFKTVIIDSYKSNLLPLSSINITGSEYVTDLTFNKAINKFMFNQLQMRDSFKCLFTAQYDSIGRVQLTGINYLMESDYNLFSFEITSDFYIGLNEPVFAANINRCFQKIYDFQLDLLKMCEEKISNKFPYSSHAIGLK